MDSTEENKYHFAREIIFNLRSCHAISEKVYLHWIDKLIKDEKASKNTVDLADVSKCLPNKFKICNGCYRESGCLKAKKCLH